MLTKAKNISLVEDVTRQIESAILEGEYRPGDKLPSTRQLQEILGASLGTIREGLAILEQKGLLEVRKGVKGGFFIREMTMAPITESLETILNHHAIKPRELYEFRTNIEAGLIRLVVQRANGEQMDSLLKFKDKFEACLDRGQDGWLEFIDLEIQFRKECLNLVGNDLYEAVLMPINNSLSDYARATLPGDDENGSEEARQANMYWAKILPAMAARDEELAANLVKDLLYHFMNLIISASQNADTTH
jgi:GntR family transcriptional repressor for pyruvate dehydrogenase complex